MDSNFNELTGYAFKEDGSCYARETVYVPQDICTQESIVDWIKSTGHFIYKTCIVFIPMSENWIKDGHPIMIPVFKKD